MKVEEKFSNPYDYARACITSAMSDKNASIFMDSCVANWDEIKTREL